MEIDIEPEGLYSNFIILTSTLDYNIFLSIILLIILLIIAGILSGSEIAFFSLSPEQVNSLENENSEISNKIINLRRKSRQLLATILIGNNFLNISIVLISDYLVREWIGEEVFKVWANRLMEYSFFHNMAENTLINIISFLITVLGVTFLLVLFAEVMPKIYANFNNLSLARSTASPITSLMNVLSFPSNIMVKYTNIIENRIARNRKKFQITDKDEIEDALDITLQRDEQELDILKSILNFNDVSVKQIMKPRIDVVSLDSTLNFNEMLSIVREHGFSRIPVYSEDLDNVIGILFAKDLISHLSEKKDFDWLSLVRNTIYYVPESKKINEILKDFQKQKIHIAIVVDEYGGTSGIVTMEDIMEEILGEILDEFDEEEFVDYEKVDDNTYLFEGKTSLIDFIRLFDEDPAIFNDYKGESDSLAGMILETAGELPEKNFQLNVDKYSFIVDSVSHRRIERILVKIIQK